MNLENPLSYENVAPYRIGQLGQKLKNLGLTAKKVQKVLGLECLSDLYPLEYRYLPLFVERLSEEESPVNHVISLLVLGLPGKKDDIEQALGAANLELLCNLSLCSVDRGDIHANFTILPFEDLLIATDKVFLNVDEYAKDEYLSSDNLVWRLDKTSYIMAAGMLRKPCKTALDLGCGSGLQSLLLSRQAVKVTGVDINPRAINLAGFNALLNGITNVKFICGDLYQPVGNSKFDRIVSNPPSAPGLVKAWNREGGISGRELVEDILSGVRDHLEYGGICQTTLHLGYNEDKDIMLWLEKYLPEKEFLNFIIRHTDEREAAEYALQEAYQKSGPKDHITFHRTYQIYRAGLKAAGIERVSFGLLSAKFKEGGQPPAIRTTDLLRESISGLIEDHWS
ncbi:MAG: methyltransferase [Candidatus Edwardsbacteria bacterium]|nr:methyltransferase [Candidatus Edwardsbacteria bacterium]MBU1576349.1 methyltransferase [Candidatus Edwardsbacteria bacterium]MBU2462902.1 methyltransferase [Candidatus Edwardsbacteria bacterium]MBU2593961.1 methyltransferase [Candidatus Edwardsbacteria bacterium]